MGIFHNFLNFVDCLHNLSLVAVQKNKLVIDLLWDFIRVSAGSLIFAEINLTSCHMLLYFHSSYKQDTLFLRMYLQYVILLL